jgi:hypothetical protein
MADSVRSLLQRQVARAGRRLFLQTLVDMLVWCWVAALAVAAGWFLVQVYGLGRPVDGRCWAVAGGALGAGTLLAIVLAVLRAPSRLAAALLVDDRFGLKERVTTSLTLPAGVEQTPAGVALLEDAGQRVQRLDVPSRFPVRLSWSAALVPLCALVLVAGAIFLQPLKGQAKTDTGPLSLDQPPPNAEEIAEKLKRLSAKPPEKKDDAQDKSDKLRQIEADLDKLVNKPHDTKQDLRERTEEINDLEAEMKQRQKDLADKNQALKEQLKSLDRFSHRNDPDGPATPLEKALAKGDFKKAVEEAEKLSKKLQDAEFKDEKEKEQLENQLKELKEEIQKLAEQKEEEEKLEELNRKGELDEDALKQELEKIQQKKANLKDAKELADALEECQQCMKQGDAEGAAGAMKKAMNKMKKMGGNEEELKDLADKLQALAECKKCMGQGMCEGQNGNGMNRSRFPGTKRPETKEGDFKAQLKRERLEFDAKGQKEITDFVQGRTFKKKPSSEMAGEVKQASQEAPEALENQRLPRAAGDMTRGYYENLRNEAEADKK